MSDGSRDVKLALSYIDDAEQKFQHVSRDDNPYIVESEATRILDGELAKASECIQNAAARGEDVLSAQVKLLSAQAGMIMQVAGGLERFKMVDDGRKKWQQWADRAVAKHRELLDVSSTPVNHYLYGWALYFGDRDQEALEPLRVAESSDDDDISIKATKLIAKVEESLKKPQPQWSSSSSSGSNKKSGGCYIATACYGSYDHPDVMVFRRYRDDSLARTLAGRTAIRFYYCVSPFIAQRLGGHNSITRFIRRRLLEPLAARLRRRSF